VPRHEAVRVIPDYNIGMVTHWSRSTKGDVVLCAMLCNAINTDPNIWYEPGKEDMRGFLMEVRKRQHKTVKGDIGSKYMAARVNVGWTLQRIARLNLAANINPE